MQHAKVFESKSKGIRGMVTYQPHLNSIVVIYRGSVNLKNWFTNIDFRSHKHPDCAGCKVHKGFYLAFKRLNNSVVDHVR